MAIGRVYGAVSAQLLGQVLTGWMLLAHMTRWPDVSIWVVAFAVAAVLAPFRHDGSWRDRAAGNFGAATLSAGFLLWDLVYGGLMDSILGGTGYTLGLEATLVLVASVLFSMAGALFWMLGRESEV